MATVPHPFSYWDPGGDVVLQKQQQFPFSLGSELVNLLQSEPVIVVDFRAESFLEVPPSSLPELFLSTEGSHRALDHYPGLLVDGAVVAGIRHAHFVFWIQVKEQLAYILPMNILILTND